MPGRAPPRLSRQRLAAVRAAALELVLLATFSSGCGGDEACPDLEAAGLNVVVTDAVTGIRICDAEVFATNVDSSARERMPQMVQRAWTNHDACGYAGAWDSPGTYDVTVSRSGYAALTLSGLAVTMGPCHVNGTQVTAQLTAE